MSDARAWQQLRVACLVCLGLAAACGQQSVVSLGADLPGAIDDAGLARDDDDAAADAHTDDNDDIVNTAECNELEPVCGTDHKEYRNRCDAMDAGVGVASQGRCAP